MSFAEDVTDAWPLVLDSYRMRRASHSKALASPRALSFAAERKDGAYLSRSTSLELARDLT